MFYFIHKHIEEGLGTVAGFMGFFHLKHFFLATHYPDLITDTGIKILVAFMCGLSGGLAGLLIKIIGNKISKYTGEK